MPTRPRKPTNLPEARGPGGDEEEPIEILEVVGVDETTGAVKKNKAHRPAGSERKAIEPDPENDAQARLLDEAVKEKDRLYDQLLRKQADFDNYRKRMERERDESGAVAAREVLKRLLPVLDNMERALKTAEASRDPLRKGIELVHQQFLDLLKKEGVQPIESLGTAFDPRLHEAVEVLDVAGFEPDMVLEEMQRGYTQNDRLLRPALVKVSSGKAPKDHAEREAGEDS
ncbi:MAG TPA: nucleotide exchange factor GrpE [Candidatus Polarisedimenticolia bacterium]|jgi:molecular chaperone GrpE|nr:nucleotide exchange factor GrpE [Candidatus Polarisedimenticolia bacterium]